MAYDEAIAVVTLVGSILSFIATACVLSCFVVFHKNQRSFRHGLIFNLALSGKPPFPSNTSIAPADFIANRSLCESIDFVNSANNTISGAIYVRDRALYSGAACMFNGWIGQVSVQATDFSILAIGISTLLVVAQKTQPAKISRLEILCVCVSVWVIPLTTGTIATVLGVMVPVGNNWCWIAADRTDLRYALTHGWRLAVFFITVLIYAYIYWYFRRHMKSMLINEPESELDPGLGSQPDRSNARTQRTWPWSTLPKVAGGSRTGYTFFANDDIRQRSQKMGREVRRMLVLNGYPILYVILWIPGITNRLLQASGNNAVANSRVLMGLQASTQFVGLANALTYGWNKQWRLGQ
ncbi:G protein-coupled glucose receptor regulating Gpa2-domain-containing protein [Nemania abortiva]|nr:G protein-coupled glucose receptor regulating Gpa2-domain-containing protein [Nemania abortiva]